MKGQLFHNNFRVIVVIVVMVVVVVVVVVVVELLVVIVGVRHCESKAKSLNTISS